MLSHRNPAPPERAAGATGIRLRQQGWLWAADKDNQFVNQEDYGTFSN